jgi:hypothetical protein
MKLAEPKVRTTMGNTKPYQFDDGSNFDLKLKVFLQSIIKSFNIPSSKIEIYKRDLMDDDINIEVDKSYFRHLSFNQLELLNLLAKEQFKPETYFRIENKFSINSIFNS